jgi:hypothetical protein
MKIPSQMLQLLVLKTGVLPCFYPILEHFSSITLRAASSLGTIHGMLYLVLSGFITSHFI